MHWKTQENNNLNDDILCEHKAFNDEENEVKRKELRKFSIYIYRIYAINLLKYASISSPCVGGNDVAGSGEECFIFLEKLFNIYKY